VGLRTSSQEKEKNEKRSDNNSECPYRSDKPIKDQCEDTDVCDYQTNTSPGSLTGEFRPSSTSPSTPGPRVLSLDRSDLRSISLEKSTKGGHRSPLGGITIHRPSRRRTCLHPRLDLIRNIHHPRQTPRDSNQQKKLNYNGYPFEQLDATSQEPGGK
jgi:hypothetical protein